jgi:predicted nucleotidyltransferase
MMDDIVDAGLDARARSLVHAVLARHPEVSEARIFGSRALERHRPESDVDLALYGDVDDVLANRIAGELDELPLPYAFDVCAYSQLRHSPLREHIDRVGRRLFVRASPLGFGTIVGAWIERP